ncbi:MAG: ABC transporter permease [Bacteroidales bacterium]|nr:ABC transporter permease [Bacteroidales bacterium]MBN2758715.1 ABC transporter permease [Bacteroidales bacterium]
MLKNFLKIAYRNLFRYKFYSIINILGFSIGLSAFLLAYIYTCNSLSFDKFHHKSNRIYRIANIYEKDSTLNKYATTPFPLSKSLLNEYPEFIESSFRIFNFQEPFQLVEYNNRNFNEKNFFFADSSILEVFDFKFVQQSKKESFFISNSVIISESAKEKYFGKYNPLGKEITVNEGIRLKVTGVFKDYPKQSHLHFDFITPISTLSNIIGNEPQTWLWNACWTYVLTKPNINKEKLEKQLPAFVNKYFDKDIRNYSSLYLQKLSDIHLKSELEDEIEENNRSIYIYVILGTSIFLLLIAMINFINLSIVGSVSRIKEISVRKVLGANKFQLILLFMTEAFLLSFFSLLIALFFVETSISVAGKITDNQFNIGLVFNYNAFTVLFSIIVFTSIIVGLNTGLYTSGFSLLKIIRNKTRMGNLKWISGKFLILLQYTISLILLILVLINFNQLLFLKNSDLGFNEKNIVVIPVGNTSLSENYKKVKSLLLKNKNIVSATAMDNIIGTKCFHKRYFYYLNNEKKVQFFPEITVRDNFLQTFNIKILEGNDFDNNQNFFSDTIVNDKIIINKTLASSFNNSHIKNVINKKLFRFQGNEKIAAVIKDFNTNSLHNPLSPLVIRVDNNENDAIENTKYLAIKLNENFTNNDLKYIYKVWRRFEKKRPFEIKFLSEILNKQYKNEDLLNFFLWMQSLLVIIISGLGIWAVTYFLSVQRTKEIGIRKAIGASVFDIINLFSKDFIKMILIANIFAWPIAYFLINKWLSIFAYRVEINFFIFLLAALLMLFQTLLIVWLQAFKVSNSNPVKALRDE